MSWQPCVSLIACTSCNLQINPGEPLFLGEVVKSIRYCVSCAKRRVDQEPPEDLPRVAEGQKTMARAELKSGLRQLERRNTKSEPFTPIQQLASWKAEDFRAKRAGDNE